MKEVREGEGEKGYLISDEGDGLLAAEQIRVAKEEETLWSEKETVRPQNRKLVR